MATSQPLEESPPIIIILGPPGSGKGTQAQRLTSRCAMTHLSPGALLRALKKRDPETLPQETKDELEKMERGEMVGHQLVYDLMFDRIEDALRGGYGVIIDGAIRTPEQVKGYTDFFDSIGVTKKVVVVWIGVEEEESIKRLTARKYLVAGEWVRRDDDVDKEAMNNRFAIQGNAAQKPVLDLLVKKVHLEKIDGHGTIDEVEDRIASALVEMKVLKKRGNKYVC